MSRVVQKRELTTGRLYNAFRVWEKLKKGQFNAGFLIKKITDDDVLICGDLIGWMPAVDDEKWKWIMGDLYYRDKSYHFSLKPNLYFGISEKLFLHLFCNGTQCVKWGNNKILTKKSSLHDFLSNVKSVIYQIKTGDLDKELRYSK